MDDLSTRIQDVGPGCCPEPITITIDSTYKMNGMKARELIYDILVALRKHLVAATVSSSWGHKIPLDVVLNQTAAQAANPPSRVDEAALPNRMTMNAVEEARQLAAPERKKLTVL